MGRMQEQPPEHSAVPSSPADSVRLAAAQRWAAQCLGLENVALIPVSGDASFRRYYRVQAGNRSVILMDAPPEQENSAAFIDIDRRLRKAGLHAPEILDFDLQLGFGLLEDLGDELYRAHVSSESVDRLFPGLFDLLRRMAVSVDASGLPPYDDNRLQTELDLFTDWYLGRHRERSLAAQEVLAWEQVCAELKRSAAKQPQVFVHRDFHSCNLLYLPGQAPGLIDFQDAVCGPLSYDFISLLWDRYVSWPRDRLEEWMETYRKLLDLDIHPQEWRRWCDLMGLQRNLKVVGIFSRLHYRDGKTGYLEMIPRFYSYLLDVLARYPEFSEFKVLLEQIECAP